MKNSDAVVESSKMSTMVVDTGLVGRLEVRVLAFATETQCEELTGGDSLHNGALACEHKHSHLYPLTSNLSSDEDTADET